VRYQALRVALKGVRTEGVNGCQNPRKDGAAKKNRHGPDEGPMAPEIALERQRLAEYMFPRHVEQMLAHVGQPKVRAKEPAARKDAIAANEQS
jgi:hypothetical protein